MNTLALATLNHIINIELMALATISKFKSNVYKTWQPLAEKWQHLASDTCTVNENHSQFVFSLPYLPEKVQSDVMFDPEYSSDEMLDNIWGCTDFDFDAKFESSATLADDYNILFDSDGYQVAQQLVILFYGFLQSVLLPYCLDLLYRVIQIVHDTRSVIVDKYCDDSFVYLDIGGTA